MSTENLQQSADDQTIDNNDQTIDNNDQTIDNSDQKGTVQEIDLSNIPDETQQAIINKAIKDGKVVDYEKRFKPVYGSMKHYERENQRLTRGASKKDDTSQGGKKEEPEELVKPKPEDFPNYEEYLDARSDYDREIIRRENSSKQQSDQATANQQKAEQEKEEYWDKVFMEAENKDPEFKEKVMSGKIYIPDNDEMLDLLFGTEFLVEFGEYFGENPAEVGRILSLSHKEAVREIINLETKFTGPPQKSETGAPENTNKNSGGKTVLHKKPEDMDMDEYEAHRKEQGYKP